MKKRILSVALTFAMALSLIPMVNATAFSAAASEKYPDKVWDVPDGKLYAVGSTIKDSKIVPGQIGAKLDFTGDSSGNTGWSHYKKQFKNNSNIYAIYGYNKGKFYYYRIGSMYSDSPVGNFEFDIADDETLTFVVDSDLYIQKALYAKGGTFKIETRNDASLRISPDKVSGDHYVRDGASSNAALYVMNNGSLEIGGYGGVSVYYEAKKNKRAQINPRYGICAGNVTVKDNAGLVVDMESYKGNIGDRTSGIYVQKNLSIDTISSVGIYFSDSTSAYLHAVEFGSASEASAVFKNASFINLMAGSRDTLARIGTQSCNLVDMLDSDDIADGIKARSYIDDSFKIERTIKNGELYKENWSRTINETATLIVGENMLNDPEKLETVEVNGGKYLQVKSMTTLPDWLKRLYDDGRVKLGENYLHVYEGAYWLAPNIQINSTNMPGYMVAVNMLQYPKISYETTNFKPVAGKTYSVHTRIPIVTVDDEAPVAIISKACLIRAVEKKDIPVLSGCIEYTGGTYYGSSVSVRRTGELSKIESAKLNYQWQKESGSDWNDISGANKGGFNINDESLIGKRIRLRISAEGYKGVVYSEPKTVKKAVWYQAPAAPMLHYDKTNLSVIVSNAVPEQQYLLSESAMDSSTLTNADSWTQNSTFKVLNDKHYYVYTRMADTATHDAGNYYRYSTITTADKVYLNKVTLEGYTSYGPNNTVYIEQGKTIDIPVVMEPSNANVWSEFEFKSPTPETSFTVTSPKDRVVPGTEIKRITVKGNSVGSGLLGAYKGNNDNYGQWRIVVYDPDNITDYRLVDPPVYSDTTLAVGSTHMPERSISEINKTKLTDPAGALKDKALEWRVMKPAESMVGTPGYVLDNGYISIDKNTGKVTAKAANTAAGISGYYKTAALCAVNSSGSVTKQISSYKVSVNAAQAVGPEAGKPEGGAPGDVTPGGAAGGLIGEGVTDISLFSDVPPNAYYKDAVKWAVEKKITAGKSNTSFAPDNKCDRAQAVTFLWRAAGSPAPESASMPFADVPEGSYYYDAVLWALENGVTQGISDTAFGPDRSCSRGQIATFIWRSHKSPAGGGENPFVDVSDSDYYAKAVSWAVDNKITNGTAADTFSPGSSCTRAQIVTFIFRALS